MTDENDDRKIVITPSDENTEKIGKILANETCRKILDVLSNEPLSSTQIAEKMGIPLTTVESNIDRMAEVGMIRVHHKQWSPKGRKVNFYEPAEKLILIAPKAKTKTKISQTLRMFILPTIAVLILLVGFLTFYEPGDSGAEVKPDSDASRLAAELDFQKTFGGAAGDLGTAAAAPPAPPSD